VIKSTWGGKGVEVIHDLSFRFLNSALFVRRNLGNAPVGSAFAKSMKIKIRMTRLFQHVNAKGPVATYI
jgi:hypothetical protein